MSGPDTSVVRARKRASVFSPYYGVAEFRMDTWHALVQLTVRCENAERAGGDDENRQRILDILATLEQVEVYFAFPGLRAVRHLSSLLERGTGAALARHAGQIQRLLEGGFYRRRDVSEVFHEDLDRAETVGAEIMEDLDGGNGERLYCEVLVVDDRVAGQGGQELRKRLLGMRHGHDAYVYDLVMVGSYEDAIIAASLNHNIQSVVIRYSFPRTSHTTLPILRGYLAQADAVATEPGTRATPGWELAEVLASIRPELDLFMVTDDPVRNVAGHMGRSFRRIFYHQEDFLELHLSILKGIHDRYETPFFNALREHSHRPTGVFHAMPISRGKSIFKSHWVRDFGEFYGKSIFLAETSATTGDLDSLLQPHGTIKQAQEKAARAFGAQKSFFVTNGTSTANKIVVQALMSPGDIALVSRDCHKSHHYALVLAGAMPVYMDPYPIQAFSIYGAVPLRGIKQHLLKLKAAGKLDRVRMLLLTNSTFDGVIYNPIRVMQEVLAIKPDMIFVWDEAWYGFARFSSTYRQRTAMESAARLRRLFDCPAYAERYRVWQAEFAQKDQADPATWLDSELLPDPALAHVRVYATQSTHKTLTSFRQGSMIHVYDQEFGRQVHDAFDEAYMTHTSTSPNYQIIASLDVGRRQVELEGSELVEQSVALAMILRERITEIPELARYFQVLTPGELIPAEYRPSGLVEFYNVDTGYARIDEAFRSDEFVVDPTRITVHVGQTGMDGDTLRRLLMDKYDIQVNKTSRNTLLFMINIGTTRGSIAYLLEVLTQVAHDLAQQHDGESALENQHAISRVESLTKNLPALPDFSRFHPRFSSGGTSEGDLRAAFFAGRDPAHCDFLRLDGSVKRAIDSGRAVVSAGFVTPYPPGFPVLVPGQVISEQILGYLKALDVKEIHGYNPEFGLRIFKDEILAAGTGGTAQLDQEKQS
jgi:arginine decarboxylase